MHFPSRRLQHNTSPCCLLPAASYMPRLRRAQELAELCDGKNLGLWITALKKATVTKNRSPCAWCTARPNYTKMLVWNRERFTARPCKKMDGSYLETPKFPENLQQSPFLGKVRERHGELLQTSWRRSYVLEVRSWSGNDVPINLHQTNVIFCSNKKGPGLKARLSSSEVPILAERRQISAGSSLKVRSPEPAQLSSLRDPGAHDSTGPQALQGAQTVGGRLHPVRTAAAIRWWEWQTGSPPPQGLGPTSGQLWWGLWIPAGHVPQFIPWAPRSLTDLRPDELEAPRRRPGSTSYLTLPDDHHSADHWLNHPLMVTHWQLITWGRSPLWCWPMAEQDH